MLFIKSYPQFGDNYIGIVMYIILGGMSRDVIHTLASPALRGYLKKDRNPYRYIYYTRDIQHTCLISNRLYKHIKLSAIFWKGFIMSFLGKNVMGS
jgi:hypothetical protein